MHYKYHAFLIFLLLSHMCFLCSAEKNLFPEIGTTKSYLALYSEQKVEITLPYKYYTMSDSEKKDVIPVEEGQYTFLKKEGDAALVGPITMTQFLVLSIDNNNAIIVALLIPSIDLNSLLQNIKQHFSEASLSKSTGQLLALSAQSSNMLINHSEILLKQKETLSKAKKIIVDNLNMQPRQLRAQFFNSPDSLIHTCYPMARNYVYIGKSANTVVIGNTCPIAEQYGFTMSVPYLGSNYHYVEQEKK